MLTQGKDNKAKSAEQGRRNAAWVRLPLPYDQAASAALIRGFSAFLVSKGLEKILLDIDAAIRLIRETDEESEVVPNLMVFFGIDEVQAEYVAEIKLRHINREYILKRTQETDDLKTEIAEMEELVNDDKKIGRLIIDELREIIRKYGQPRRTMFL